MFVRFEKSVDAIDYPAKEASIECFGHGISDISGFFHSVGTNNGFSSSYYAVRGKCLLQFICLNTQQGCTWEVRSQLRGRFLKKKYACRGCKYNVLQNKGQITALNYDKQGCSHKPMVST